MCSFITLTSRWLNFPVSFALTNVMNLTRPFVARTMQLPAASGFGDVSACQSGRPRLGLIVSQTLRAFRLYDVMYRFCSCRTKSSFETTGMVCFFQFFVFPFCLVFEKRTICEMIRFSWFEQVSV